MPKLPQLPIAGLSMVITATAVVVPADSPTLIKAAARVAKVLFGGRIQVCDGTDDHVEIQAAFDALPATGGRVILLNGTFYCGAIIRCPSTITFKGQGRATVLYINNGVNDYLIQNSDPVGGNNNIVVRSLSIDGNKGNQTAGGGLRFTNVTDCLCEDLYITNTWEGALDFVRCDRVYVKSCYGYLIGQNLIGGMVGLNECNNCIVDGLIVVLDGETAGDLGVYIYSFTNPGTYRNFIVNNVMVLNGGRSCVSLEADNDPPDKDKLIENILISNCLSYNQNHTASAAAAAFGGSRRIGHIKWVNCEVIDHGSNGFLIHGVGTDGTTKAWNIQLTNFAARGCGLECARIAAEVDDIKLSQMHLEPAANHYGIYITGATHVGSIQVDGGEIVRGGKHSIFVDATSPEYLSFSNVRCLDASDTGVRINPIGGTAVHLRNVYISGAGNHGLHVDTGDSDLEELLIEGCTSQKNNGNNCYIQKSGTGTIHRIRIKGCWFRESATDQNFSCEAHNDVQLVGAISEGAYLAGLVLNGVTRGLIEACISKNNGQSASWDYGILIMGAASDILLTGNHCYDDQVAKTQGTGIRIQDDADYITLKGNNLRGNATTGYTNTSSGTNFSFDREVRSTSLDLSGVATDIEVFHANVPCLLVGYAVVYTEASSADPGVDIRIGRYQDGVALDDDYFDVSTSEASKDKGYKKYFRIGDLTNSVIAAGDTVTVGTAGGKTGAGEVMLILQIAEMAD
ncbi:MAG: right-handed parallel beta-helix repeat-containing protein [Deltaproteobacteria bacterium]|nr:right-handed parallel beta-helix repeat-containing protein [Deltaproteobacteria bacterium]